MERKKVLIADDDLCLVRTLRYLLERRGIEVLCTANGYEALGMVRAEEPDVVLLDVLLPNLSGYRISRLIKEDERGGRFSRKIAVLIMTAGRAENPERERYVQAWSQADQFLYKPFGIEELKGRLEALLSPPAVLQGAQAS